MSSQSAPSGFTTITKVSIITKEQFATYLGLFDPYYIQGLASPSWTLSFSLMAEDIDSDTSKYYIVATLTYHSQALQPTTPTSSNLSLLKSSKTYALLSSLFDITFNI